MSDVSSTPHKRFLMHQSVEAAITLYRPQRSLCPHFDEYAEICQDAVRKASPPTSQAAINLLVTLTQFLEWCRQEGLPYDIRQCLRPEHVDRFGRFGLPRLGDLGRSTRVGALRRIGRGAAPKWWATRTPLFRPTYDDDRLSYSREEVAAYWIAAEHQTSSARRRYFRAVLALGLGAGLGTREIVVANPHDLVYKAGLLCIETHGSEPRARVIPVRRLCADVLLDLASEAPHEQFAHNAPIRHADPIARMRQFIEVPGDLPPLTVKRMRNTWLLSLLNDRVDLATLTQIAGTVDTRFLQYFLSSITPESPERAWGYAAGEDSLG